MNVENPAAFRFIMQDDVYLLNNDKAFYSVPAVLHQHNTAAEPQPEYKAPIPVPPIAKPGPASFNYLGENKKGFLVITHYPDHDFMHDRHLAALESTLGRLGFNRDDAAVFNRAKYTDAGFAALTAFFKPEKLLLLGPDSLPAGFTAPALNKPTQLNGCPLLFTFSFDEMMDSIENKKAFWEQMKQL